MNQAKFGVNALIFAIASALIDLNIFVIGKIFILNEIAKNAGLILSFILAGLAVTFALLSFNRKEKKTYGVIALILIAYKVIITFLSLLLLAAAIFFLLACVVQGCKLIPFL